MNETTVAADMRSVLSKVRVNPADSEYFDYNGHAVTAQSVSYFKHFMHSDKGYRIPRNIEIWVSDYGFKAVAGKNSRGQNCMIVVEKEA